MLSTRANTTPGATAATGATARRREGREATEGTATLTPCTRSSCSCREPEPEPERRGACAPVHRPHRGQQSRMHICTTTRPHDDTHENMQPHHCLTTRGFQISTLTDYSTEIQRSVKIQPLNPFACHSPRSERACARASTERLDLTLDQALRPRRSSSTASTEVVGDVKAKREAGPAKPESPLLMAAASTAPLPTLAIVGTARDVAGRAGDTVPGAIRRLSSHFALQRLIVVESDSVDGTLEEIETWPDLLRDEVGVDIVSQKLELLYPPHRYPQFKLRAERIAYAVRACKRVVQPQLYARGRAPGRSSSWKHHLRDAPPRASRPHASRGTWHATSHTYSTPTSHDTSPHLTPPLVPCQRNTLLERVAALEPAPTYMLVMDLDGVNSGLLGVETCLDLPVGWGGCCANQHDVYYDIWALRTFDDWVDCDVW